MWTRRLPMLAMIALALLTVACQKANDQRPTLLFATDASVPPMAFTDRGHKVVGYDVDFAQAVAKAAGYRAQIVYVPWDRQLIELEAGRCDAVVSAITALADRGKLGDFSEPYLQAGLRIVVRADSSVAGPKDLEGTTVGNCWGTANRALSASGVKAKLENYEDTGSAFRDLRSGAIDALIIDEPIALYNVREVRDHSLKVVGPQLTDDVYVMLIRKGNTKVLEVINAAIRKVAGSSEDQRMKRKWFQ